MGKEGANKKIVAPSEKEAAGCERGPGTQTLKPTLRGLQPRPVPSLTKERNTNQLNICHWEGDGRILTRGGKTVEKSNEIFHQAQVKC